MITKSSFFKALSVATLVSVSGLSSPSFAQNRVEDVEAGPIWSTRHATSLCPTLAARVGGTWTGAWNTTVPGRMSVCNIDFGPQNTEIAQPEQPQADASTPSPLADDMLNAHNRYRSEVGVAPLTWSATLADSAQAWANQLAATDSFAHSSSDYGENLWKGTAGAFSTTEMVDGWGSEKQYFISGAAFPSVSTTGNWSDVGHYTQMIWSNTTQVGCGLATGSGFDVLVCQYDPPGNFIGQPPF